MFAISVIIDFHTLDTLGLSRSHYRSQLSGLHYYFRHEAKKNVDSLKPIDDISFILCAVLFAQEINKTLLPSRSSIDSTPCRLSQPRIPLGGEKSKLIQ